MVQVSESSQEEEEINLLREIREKIIDSTWYELNGSAR